MSNQRVSMHGMWSSRTVFVMATIGSAVGLGNIWKFPYITGQYGGGAFVVVYLLCIALIGIPIGVALALSVGGLYFLVVYLRAFSRTGSRHEATLESTRAHTAYNGVIIGVVLVLIAAYVALLGIDTLTADAVQVGMT